MHDLMESDAVEDQFGKLVIDMDDWELIAYLKACLRELHDVELVTDNSHRDRAMIRRLRKLYGDEYGALVIKWAVRGRRAKHDNGQIISFSSFAKGWSWWINVLYAEVQAAMLAPMRQAEAQKRFVTSADILAR